MIEVDTCNVTRTQERIKTQRIDEGNAEGKDLTKDSFLDILRRGSKDQKQASAIGAPYLKEDYMMQKNKLKHYDQPVADVEEEHEFDDAPEIEDFDDEGDY